MLKFLIISNLSGYMAYNYGVQLKKQTFQNLSLSKITNAPPFISNYSLCNDLNINTVNKEAISFYKRFHAKLVTHHSSLIKNLFTMTLPGIGVNRGELGELRHSPPQKKTYNPPIFFNIINYL